MGIINKYNDYNYIYGYSGFSNDLERLYKNEKHNALNYSIWLDKKLRQLDNIGLLVLNEFPKTFEKLEGQKEGIYSIRRKNFVGNPRVLFFSMEEDDEEQVFILLTAFKEKNTADYDRATATAQERRKNILKILKEGEKWV